MASATAAIGEVAAAVLLHDHALSSLPSDWKADPDLCDTVELVYREKAVYYQWLGRPDDAIQAYTESRAALPDRPLDGSSLDDITRVLGENVDAAGSRLLALLKTWKTNELMAWFDYMFDYSDNNAVTRLNHITARNGNDGRQFVLDCYNKYIASISVRSARIILPQIALAHTYQKILNQPKEAKAINSDLLKRGPRDHSVSGIVEKLSELRLTYSDALFEEFRQCKNAQEKVAILQEMRQLANQIGTIDWMFLRESNMSIALALMTRAVGTPAEYEEILRNTFEACVGNLSDSVGWNDSSSLRLLARVLSCVAGLERDALIATSCQFSQVTQEPATNSSIPSASGSVVDMDEGDNRAGAEEQSEKVDDNDQVEVIGKAVISLTLETEERATNLEATEYFDTIAVNDPMPLVAHTGASAIEGAQFNLSTEDPTELDPNTATEQDSPAIAIIVNEGALSTIEDEDIADGWAITCDGECDGSFSSWDEPLYLCILCPNTDLCRKCHRKRLAQNAGEPNLYWRSYCGKNHQYLKGPMKGWKGVKNGRMRIEDEEGNLEDVGFKEWLRGLKEERWVEAWEMFWLKSADVRDIGC